MMTTEHRTLLRAWIRAVVEHSWTMPYDQSMAFLKSEFEILEKDFKVKLNLTELRTVEIVEDDSDEPPTEEQVRSKLKLV